MHESEGVQLLPAAPKPCFDHVHAGVVVLDVIGHQPYTNMLEVLEALLSMQTLVFIGAYCVVLRMYSVTESFKPLLKCSYS